MALDPQIGTCLSLVIAMLAVLAATCTGSGGASEANAPGRALERIDLGDPGRTAFDLPPPERTGGLPLDAALAGRRSVRDFDPRPLDLGELSQLLWAAQGVTSSDGGRTAPSAGATFPLEMRVILAEGVFRYLAGEHRLERLDPGDRRGELADAAVGQRFVAAAPACLVIGGVEERTAKRYGERAGRYVALEAGAAAQNILLQAEALGLGAVWVGAFDDQRIAALARLPSGAVPYAVIPAGAPAKEEGRR
jgi:SagB-type dehydrogenase family enzyme